MPIVHPAARHFIDWATAVVNYAYVKAQVPPRRFIILFIFADNGRGVRYRYHASYTPNPLFSLMNAPLIPAKYEIKWDYGGDN